MKPLHAILLFSLLLFSSLLAGGRSYEQARRSIVSDMNRALALTLQQRRDVYLTPDTIRTYRQNLRLSSLRDKSTLTYGLAAGSHALASRRVRHGAYEVQGVADLSQAEIFAFSDQTLPLSLLFLSSLWAATSLVYFRRGRTAAPSLSYAADTDTFFAADHEALSLTPMQHRLMRLFLARSSRRLSKQEICDALWPKKPDASETLYTLIRRTRSVIESRTSLTIVSERGGYRLTDVRSKY